jgi:hypothetical protein
MTTVRLPDGCKGLDMQDGAKYSASKPGGLVDMEPAHARAISKGWYGQSGTMRGGPQFSFGTRAGRVCPCSPGRPWNAWSKTCPKCGGPTQPE